MTALSAETWPWLASAALGAFHGLNPAMGWLFAVALGLHRGDRRFVLLSPILIALGHAMSVVAVAASFLWMGSVVDPHAVRIGAAFILIGWAVYHWRYGHRHRVRFGMQAGAAALVAWSLLMGTAHGAGLMLWPVLIPLCVSPGAMAGGAGPLATALMVIAVHMLAMLTVATAIAIAVYEWVGLAILRRAWINCDLIWTFGLAATGGVLLVG
jgi:hypothetical protein